MELKEKKTANIYLPITPSLKERVRKECERKYTTMAQFITDLIVKYFRQEKTIESGNLNLGGKAKCSL